MSRTIGGVASEPPRPVRAAPRAVTSQLSPHHRLGYGRRASPARLGGFIPSRRQRGLLPHPVKPVTSDNFGLVIGYLVPGFVTLWGLRPFVPTVGVWLAATPGAAPTIDGLLYATLAATAAGLIVGAVRWAVIDRLYHRTGIPAPDWDFGRLPANLAAFESHVHDHYRFYQGYSNLLVAIAFAYGLDLAAGSRPLVRLGWADVAVAVVLVVLVLGSRDALHKYYARTGALLAPPAPRPAGRARGRRSSRRRGA